MSEQNNEIDNIGIYQNFCNFPINFNLRDLANIQINENFTKDKLKDEIEDIIEIKKLISFSYSLIGFFFICLLILYIIYKCTQEFEYKYPKIYLFLTIFFILILIFVLYLFIAIPISINGLLSQINKLLDNNLEVINDETNRNNIKDIKDKINKEFIVDFNIAWNCLEFFGIIGLCISIYSKYKNKLTIKISLPGIIFIKTQAFQKPISWLILLVFLLSINIVVNGSVLIPALKALNLEKKKIF